MEFFWKKKPKAYRKMPYHLRVVTFNVHYAAKPYDIAEAIRANPNLKDADIFLFQEIEFHNREIISRAETIAEELGFSFIYAPARKIKSIGTHGLAIVSKYQLKDPEIIKLPHYPLLLRSRQRIALTGTLEVGKEKIQIYNVHLDTTLNINDRIRQLSVLTESMRQHPDKKIILGGDFNTLPWKIMGRSIPVGYTNQRRLLRLYLAEYGLTTTTQRTGYTLRRGIIGFQLDSIYTKGLKILRSKVERTVKVSDHKPLWADVRIKTPTTHQRPSHN